MARPENPITAEGPTATFAMRLRTVRQNEGNPKYRTMAARSGYSHTALSQAANGLRLPSWDCVQAYLGACGIKGVAELAEWQAEWESTRRAVQLRKATEIGDQNGGGRPDNPAAPAPLTSTLPNLGRVAFHFPLATGVQASSVVASELFHAEDTTSVAVMDRSNFPAPSLNGLTTMAELVVALNEAIVKHGHTVKELYSRIATSTLPMLTTRSRETGAGVRDVREALTGRRPLTQKIVLRVIDACGGADEDRTDWTLAFQHVRALERRAQVELDKLKQNLLAQDRPRGALAEVSLTRTRPPTRPGVHRAADTHLRLTLMYIGAGTLAVALGAVLTLLIQNLMK